MSIHPSLKSTEKEKKQRSVLKRSERIKMMQEKGKWKEGDDVFGLPKIKTLKIKIKKEKAAEKPEGAVEEAAVSAAAGEAKEEETPKAPKAAKAPSGKAPEKK